MNREDEYNARLDEILTRGCKKLHDKAYNTAIDDAIEVVRGLRLVPHSNETDDLFRVIFEKLQSFKK